ncbi:polysaccharide deacetylase family protein [Aestuariicella sp. G3-2]|uniref:polysaccharide deacetylase family protein n=1 Tax=Pseudomaricurvus albidus TaxID=2842452 RepID=UPI001C0C202C|nr:polysaccharide deacetylase family protein [Aestuariicella albida]MBU3070884.1 polysaccharide deacetylase family protein [Aestuariicella albida]
MVQSTFNLLATRLLPKVLSVEAGKRLSILVYHRVLDRVDPMRPGIPDVMGFDWQMEVITRYFQPLSMMDALARLDEGTLPPRSVCVTFDDGYADNLIHALPVLQRWNVPATVFVSSGFLDGGRMWNDSVIEAFTASDKTIFELPELGFEKVDITKPETRMQTCYEVIKRIKYIQPEQRLEKVSEICKALGSPKLPDNLMLTRDELRLLSKAGIEIGNHTVTHPVLTAIDNQSVLRELKDNTRDLQDVTQKPVKYFAYPNGIPNKDFNEEHKNIVKDLGFEGAVTTEWGVSSRSTDRWALPRFTPWDKSPQRFAMRIIMNMRSLR